MSLAIIFVTMIYVGDLRTGSENVSFANLMKKVFVQSTASDVAYVFNSAIDYSKNSDLLMGKTYLTYIVKAIPLLDYPLRTDKILLEEYSTPGGDFFLDEPLMNFGVVGIIIYPLIELGIYYLILKKKTDYRFFLWIFLIATTFRTSWYGLLYIEKGIIYFIPIMYLIKIMFNKRRIKLNGEKNG